MADAAAYLALARPRHWIKNVFALMPIPHALASGARLEPGPFALGLLAMCLASSAVYALNDRHDAALDRLHPDKRVRPVAAGRVSPNAAGLFALVLVLAAFGLGLASGHPRALLVLALYVLLNLVYSLWGRAVALLDVALLSSGYVLRVLLGCVLIDAVPSSWLLLCTSALALFLAFAKRRGDLAAGLDGSHRPSLSGYTLPFLDQAMGITAGLSVMAYALYCMEAEVFLPGREFATLPFVVLGVLESLRAVHVRGMGGSPVDMVYTDPVLLLAGVGWAVTTLLALDL